MPTTISRLLMCFGVLFGAVVVYLPVFVYVERRGDDDIAFAVAGVVSCACFAAGWLMVWRGAVNWSPQRIAMTATLIPMCMVPAGVFFVICGLAYDRRHDPTLGLFVGTLTWAGAWLIGSALVWRENARERGERLRRLGIHAVACPDCGYNLTGLKEAKCPECGAAYTLDQLYASIADQRAELDGE